VTREKMNMTNKTAVAVVVAIVAAWNPAAGGAEPASKPATAPPTRPADVLTLDLGGGVSMKFIKISAGKFTMGVPADSPLRQRKPPVRDDEHGVTITKGFWMGVTEVTQAQYEAITGDNPSKSGKVPEFPVDGVTFTQAEEFCKKLSARTGKIVRMPADEEWEYAAKAGGDGLGGAKVTDVAWCKENGEGKPHAVGGKAPNAWGLYDMLGNVGEWVKAQKGVYYRGGNWRTPERFTLPALREAHATGHNDPYGGFRVVVEEK